MLIRRFVTCLSLAFLLFCMAGFGFLFDEPYVGKTLIYEILGRLTVFHAFADMSLSARFFGAGLTGLAISVIVASIAALPYAFLWLGLFMDHAYVAEAEVTVRSLSWKLAFAWRTTACVIGMLVLTPVGAFGLLAAARFWQVQAAVVVVLLVVLCGAVSWVVTLGGILIRRFVWAKRR